MALTRVATVQEVPLGGGKQVTVNGRKIGLFNTGGTIYALDDTCPHRGAPLSQGPCEGTEVFCPLHGASFDLATGAHLSPPATRGVTAYTVQVVGDEIYIDV
jgi:3-phenylpropionate/trans-cinnamate dioxygenase ferredoxin component